jgi:hypothetical protein
MLTRLHISLLLAIAVAVWVVVLMIRGIPVTPDLLIPYGVAVSALTALCLGFNLWCWRFVVFKGWLVHRPWIQGTWKVTLQSSWVDPTTGQQIGPIEGFMVVRQSFSTLSLRLLTAESSSTTVSSAILKDADGVYRVVATYRNEPSAELRGVRSEIHYGALQLDVHGDIPDSLTGHYWTDRKTTGTLKLTDRKLVLANGFAHASSLFGT